MTAFRSDMGDLGLDGAAGDWQALRASFRWQVPARYNLAQACCRRWADERARFALYYEDEAGHTEAWTFWDVQQAANRLSNVLGAMGVMAGDRVALILPQRPETAVAHMACYQMGALAVPLASAAATLAHSLAQAEARVAIVDEHGLERLAVARAGLPLLKHVIGVGTARESWLRDWAGLLALGSSRYTPRDTAANDAALILYGRDAGGQPRGVVLAQRTLLGMLPGFVCAQDFYPQRGDLFWSPADWSDSAGLLNALLPCWSFGQPLLAYRGGFDPDKAFWLMEKYAVGNSLLSPAALAAMMQAQALPREKYELVLRSLGSSGEQPGADICQWARQALGVTLNRIYGQTEVDAIVGDSATITPPIPGAMGRAYPGHRVAVLNAAGQPVAVGASGELCIQRSCDGILDPALMLGYWQDPLATAEKFFGRGVDDPLAWWRTGVLATLDEDGVFWRGGAASGAQHGSLE